MYTTQVRNGVEIAYIDNSPYFDFNYQTVNYLQTPIVLQPVSLAFLIEINLSL